ncbi:MAG: AMP-binding protein, partial [Acidimicrobiia bacterium]
MTVVWRPTPDRAAASNTAAFMREHQISTVEDLRQRSASDPEWFWEAVVDFLGLPFERPWRTIRDTSRGDPWATWFVGGGFNLSQACVDRWADDDPGRIALRSEKETGETRELTFGEMKDVVGRLGAALKGLGVSKGDSVAVFLPMGVEAVVSLLAVARLGAIFIPVFSGYGAEAVATRLGDPRPKAMI